MQAQILDLLGRERTDRNMAMILVTHDLGVVAGRANEIAVMYAGRIVEKAPTRTLFHDMKMPYTEALVNSIPRLDYDSHTRLEVIPGRPPNLISPAARLQVRAPLQVRPSQVPRRGAAAVRGVHARGHLYRCWYPVGTVEPTVDGDRRRGSAVPDRPPVPVEVV